MGSRASTKSSSVVGRLLLLAFSSVGVRYESDILFAFVGIAARTETELHDLERTRDHIEVTSTDGNFGATCAITVGNRRVVPRCL